MEYTKSKDAHQRLIIIILILFYSWPTSAMTTPASNTQLAEVTSHIQKIQYSLSLKEQQQVDVENQLQKTELSLATLAQQLAEINNAQQREQQKLYTLTLKQHHEERQLAEQHIALAAHLRSAYQLNKLNELKILLDQQDPSATNRLLTYHRYFTHERMSLINAIKSSTLQLKNTLYSIQLQQAILQHLLQTKQLQYLQQQTELAYRKQLILRLHHEINHTTSELSTLMANQKTLETELNHLAIQPLNNSNDDSPFRSLKGKLTWPLRGKIISSYGTPLNHSDALTTGIILQAPFGTPIRSIANGTVIFANWLRGFGLLLIINHSNGFMSLYGRNQAIYVKAGEVVKAGDIVANIGNTGGFDKTGLYFEIRENGIPVNPSKWCRYT